MSSNFILYTPINYKKSSLYNLSWLNIQRFQIHSKILKIKTHKIGNLKYFIVILYPPPQKNLPVQELVIYIPYRLYLKN